VWLTYAWQEFNKLGTISFLEETLGNPARNLLEILEVSGASLPSAQGPAPVKLQDHTEKEERFHPLQPALLRAT